jgi:23S rRNA pseudouridine1911/1915/1917 synthase
VTIPESDGTLIHLTLGPEARGLRLDRALADRLPEHSRTVVTAWIREGRVRMGGVALSPKAKALGGEVVEIHVPAPEPSHLLPQDLPLEILYEDESLLVIHKPSGLTVHPGAGQRDGTLANALVYHLQGLPALGGAERPGIVHRLDKDTSGVMVVARTEAAQRALSAAFAAREMQKVYLAVVHGRPDDDEGVIDEPIGRAPNHRTKMAVRPERGRSAVTGWSVERTLPRHALLRCRPRTGRTHQLRVHLQHLGHPILGDPIYGRRDGPGEALAPRLLLHAFSLGFRHPGSGEEVHFEAPLPQDFQTALETLAQLDPPRRAP